VNFPFARFIADLRAWRSNTEASGLTAIEGRSVATAAQMQSYIRRVNANVAASVVNMIPHYITEGNTENIRGDIAFALCCLETGNFRFTGGTAVTLDQNNFGGIGVTQTGMKGESFPSPQMGIRAIIQRLKAYANRAPLVNDVIGNSRFGLIQRGVAPYVDWLGAQDNPQGLGWATGAGYGKKILDILAGVLRETGAVITPPPPEVIRDKTKVRLRQGAKYFSGANIPAWVFNDVWVVEGEPNAATGRAVINWNASLTKNIMSPVHVKDLIVV